MAVPYYKAIPGKFILIGKEPDGDSVRFIADDLTAFSDLHRAFRIKPARTDNSVQLRFEAVDTPEVHYGTAEQLLGKESRDAMLSRLGFATVSFGGTSGNQVTASTPEMIEGIILTKAADANGRPISYVLTQNDAENLPLSPNGWNHVDDTILAQTINHYLLEQGYAYYTVYSSTPVAHRAFLRPVADQARTNQRNLWATDDTSLFRLIDQASIGVDGNLILPKLFRRCTDYLKEVAKGFTGELTEWLNGHSSGPRPENDLVLLDGAQGAIPFSSLIEQRNDIISLKVDLMTMTFMEK